MDRYGTPQAFRTALEDRLRNLAQRQGIDLQRLRRRVAFERLLARLFEDTGAPWLLKGGFALELRLQNRARSTVDLDLTVPDPDRVLMAQNAKNGISSTDLFYDLLQQSADADLGDHFQFLIRRPKQMHIGTPKGGFRCSVETRMAGRTFAQFRLDIGFGDVVLDPPEWVEGSDLLGFAGIPVAQVALYPLTQQFAEKIHAYTFPWQDRVSTRVKDLVDLVLLIDLGQLDPQRCREALRTTFEHRKTQELPARFPQPPAEWAETYAALAQELDLSARDLEEAYMYLDSIWQAWNLAK
jgi:predicted nucleotidyltransferase component of viral defense system